VSSEDVCGKRFLKRLEHPGVAVVEDQVSRPLAEVVEREGSLYDTFVNPPPASFLVRAADKPLELDRNLPPLSGRRGVTVTPLQRSERRPL
jgi:hypothetical protein